MAILTRCALTFIDLNEIHIGVMPTNPTNNQVWFDTTNNLLKKYNLSSQTWEIINDYSQDILDALKGLQVSSRNLLASTSYESQIICSGGANKTGGQYYFVGTINYINHIKDKEITLAFDWEIVTTGTPSGTFRAQTTGVEQIQIGNVITLSSSNYYGTCAFTTTLTTASTITGINFRTDGVTGTFKITHPRIFYGSKDLGWSQAPEDIEGKFETIIDKQEQGIYISVADTGNNTKTLVDFNSQKLLVSSSNIDLQGYVTISSLSDPSSTTTIDGNLIETDTLSANKIKTGKLQGKNSSSYFNLDNGTFSLANATQSLMTFDGTSLTFQNNINYNLDKNDFSSNLDWIKTWTEGSTTINSKQVMSPRAFFGTVNASRQATGISLGGALNKIYETEGTYSDIDEGLAGYKLGTKMFHFKTDGTLLIGPNTTGNYLSWDGSNLNVRASSINIGSESVATGSTINTAINNIQIGGRNLILKTDINKFGLGNWINNTGVGTLEGTYTDESKTIKIIGANGICYNDYIILNKDTTYTYSMMIKSSLAMTVNNMSPLHMWVNTVKDSNHLEIIQSTSGSIPANIWTQAWITFKTPNIQDIYYMKPFIYDIGNSTVYIAKVKLEKGNKATDWTPAPEDVDASINSVSTSLGTLDSSVKSAFGNSIINDSEAKAIASNIQILTNEKSDIDREYTTIYANTNLISTAQTNLYNAKIAYDSAHSSLISSINTVTADKIITTDEKTSVESFFSTYRIKLADYKQRLQEALDYISTTKANTAQSNAKSYTDGQVSSITTTTNSITSKVNKAQQIASSSLQGKMLYTDLTFLTSINNILLYNTSNNGSVVLTRVAKSTDCPTTSTNMLQITTNGTASPGIGGFCFATTSRANAIFLTKFIAKIPEGYTLNFNTNSIGTGSKSEWLTDNVGTGNWSEYIHKVTCGSTGTFSTTNYFYLTGTAPVTWYIAMATVFDCTESSNIESRLSTAENKITDDAITATVSKNFYTKQQTEDTISTKGYQTSSQVQQTVDVLQTKFIQSGGYNLIKNSTGASGTTNGWTYDGTSLSVATNDTIGSSCKSYMYLDNGTTTTERFAYSSRFKLKANTKYTLTGYYYNYTTCPNFDIWLLSSTTLSDSDTTNGYTNAQTFISSQNTNGSWEKITATITTLNDTISGYIRIDNNGYNSSGTGPNRVCWNALILVEGELEIPWSPHPSEIYEGITTIDKDGITVTSSNVKSKTSMSSNGFKITKTDTSEDVFSVNSDGTLNIKGNITVTGGSVPTSSLSGTISNTQLNSTIASDISSAKSNSDLLAQGLNKWMVTAYDITGAGYSNDTIPTFNMLANKSIKFIKEIVDSNISSSMNLGDNYIGHAKTNVYLDSDYSFTTSLTTDDAGAIYLNGILITTTGSCTAKSVTLNLKAGWNTVEVLYLEIAGGDGFVFFPKFNTTTQIRRINAYEISSTSISSNLVSESKDLLDTNKNNWSNAYNRVVEWASSAVTGSTTINGGFIETNTITAKQIAIGDFSNYSQLAKGKNLSNRFGTATWVENTSNDSYWQTSNTYFPFTINETNNPFKAGDKIQIKFDACTVTSRSVSVGVWFYSDIACVTNIGSITGSVSCSATWGTKSVNLTLPEGNTYVQSAKSVAILISNGSSGEVIQVRNAVVIRQVAGDLIVDGTITTSHINTTGLDASVIKAGTIDAARIDANTIVSKVNGATTTITGDKIRAGQISANSGGSYLNLNDGSMLLGTTSSSNYLQWTGSALNIKASSLSIGGTTAATTTNVSTAKTEAINEAVGVKDTRSTNEVPSWYMTNYPKRTVQEFKSLTAIGLTGSDTYGNLETKVPWGDSSGGYPIQTFYGNGTEIFTRKGTSNTTWSEWVRKINATQTDVFNTLTNNGSNQGIYIENGNVLINASMIKTGTLNANLITTENLTGKTITGGLISGGQININDAFKVDEFGKMIATGAEISGKLNLSAGSAVPTSTLSGTISSTQLDTAINSTLTAANSNNTLITSNNAKWTTAYSQVSNWATATPTGTTEINGNRIKTGTVLAEKIAIYDFTNYAELNPNTLSRWGFVSEVDSSASNNPWFKKSTIARDNQIGSYYKCNGGETLRIKADISTTVYGQSVSGGTDTATARSVGIMIFTKSNTGTMGYLTNDNLKITATSTSTAIVSTVNGTITLPNDTREFAVYIQIEGYPTFTGTLKARNVLVSKMASGELIVDGSITSNHIDTDSIKAEHIDVNSITSDHVDINGNGFTFYSSKVFNPTTNAYDYGDTIFSIKNEDGQNSTVTINPNSFILKGRNLKDDKDVSIVLKDNILTIDASAITTGSLDASLITTGILDASLIDAKSIKGDKINTEDFLVTNSTTGNSTFAIKGGKVYVSASDFIITSEEFDFTTLTDNNSLASELSKEKERMDKYIRFDNEIIELGEASGNYKATLSNNALTFYEKDAAVSWISGNTMYMTNNRSTDSLEIGPIVGGGRYRWDYQDNGHLNLSWFSN